MQQNRAAASQGNEGRLVRRLSGVTVVAAMTAVAGCHDAPTSVIAPVPPTLTVGTDGVWLVNSLADPGDGACTNSECTLREAIAAAQNGERVTFKSNLSGTIALSAGRLVVDKSLTIEARDPSQITVDGQGVSTVLAISSDVLVNLSGLTITGGKSGDAGGGIRVFPLSTLNLFGSVVTGNDGGNSGGGISANDATLRVIGSTIAGNTAASGGGIFVSGEDLTVVRSTISRNTSERGGGIYLECTGSANCASIGVSIRSSTITQNEAEITGGGVMSLAFANTLTNTIVAGNRRFGGAIVDEADCNFQGPPETLGYNLTSPGTGCVLTSPTDVILQSISQVFTAVLFPVLAENGSPKPTHALIERGFAVDAGYCPGEAGDQRGFPRPYDDLRMPNALDGCDIGAFEWQPAGTKMKGPKP
jgi:CSLREA domain-containing protein